MRTRQETGQVEQELRVTNQKSRNWRRIAILFMLLIIAGLLSPLIFVRVPGNWTHQVFKTHKDNPTIQQTQSMVSNVPSNLTNAAQLTNRVDSLLTGEMNDRQFSGSVLVAQSKRVLLAKGYSMANWQTRTANTPDTRFYLGSVTKEFTAMAILILQKQGKLQVSSALCSYIPNCPAPWRPLSIHEVLIHTSGIPEVDTSQLSDVSPAAWIDSFTNMPLQFAPGQQFDYCSTCYQILAYVVQQVSGIPYSRFVQQMILDPLQMKDTGFDANYYYTQPNDALGYIGWQENADQLGWRLGPQWSFLDGSGLLYSTVEDMYRWDQALYGNTLIPLQNLDQAFTPYVNATLFPGAQYGYGWFISQAPVQGHRLVWHDGIVDGFKSYIGRYVDDSVTILILSNLSSADVIGLAHAVEQLVFKQPASSNVP